MRKCVPGKLLHRAGATAFPAQHGAAPEHMPAGPANIPHDVLSIRQLARDIQAHRRQRKARIEALVTELKELSAEACLAHRQILALATKWQAVPHRCPALVACLSADQYWQACEPPGEVGRHERGWRHRHLGVPSENFRGLQHVNARARPLRVCFSELTCICGDNAKIGSFWLLAKRCLMDRCKPGQKKHDLQKSETLLLFRSRLAVPDCDVEEGLSNQHVSLVFVPHMSLKPWSPTFLGMDAADDVGQQRLSSWQHNDTEADDEFVACKCKAIEQGEPLFMIPHQLSARLDLTLQ